MFGAAGHGKKNGIIECAMLFIVSGSKHFSLCFGVNQV